MIDVSSGQIALWYYHRWNIETYFKLMKSGGQELEHWQKESAPAILKRLLVTSMAAAVVWRLQRNTSLYKRCVDTFAYRYNGERSFRHYSQIVKRLQHITKKFVYNS